MAEHGLQRTFESVGQAPVASTEALAMLEMKARQVFHFRVSR
jgi:hypothetical protein